MKNTCFLLLFGFLFVSSVVFAYDDGGQRDPFWPLVSSSGTMLSYGQSVTVDNMVIEGIISDGSDKHIAIINGQIVSEGDAIGSYQVETILANEVILLKEGESITLPLKKEK